MKPSIFALALFFACVAVPAAAGKGGPPDHAGGPAPHAGGPPVHAGGPPAHAAGGSSGHSGSHSADTRGGGKASGRKGPKRPHGHGSGHEDAETTEADDSDAADEEGGDAELNPAETCRERMLEMGVQGFALAFGTNVNRANAFGMCVSSEASGRGDDEPDAADDGAEEPDDGQDGAGDGAGEEGMGEEDGVDDEADVPEDPGEAPQSESGGEEAMTVGFVDTIFAALRQRVAA